MHILRSGPSLRFFAASLLAAACSDDGGPRSEEARDAGSSDHEESSSEGANRPDARDGGSGSSHRDAASSSEAETSEATSTDQEATSDHGTSSPTAAITDATNVVTSAPVASSSDLPSDPSSSDSGTAPTPPGSTVFVPDQVLDIRLSLAPTDAEDLEEHGNLEAYYPARVSISGDGFTEFSSAQVGLRHKGSYTLLHCWDESGVRSYEAECAKLSYKLKFDEYDSTVRFDGLKRLNLHASSNDNTKLRELLAYKLFAEFGVDAPRVGLARVTINEELVGMFVAVEEIDGRFTNAHYPEAPDGNLYKEIWPAFAQNEAGFIEALETNKTAPDVSDMLAFATAIETSTVETFEAQMAPWIDIDEVVRYLVVDRALKNWDGIMAFYEPLRPHNFFWYRTNATDGRFHLIPWDMDNTFWFSDPYMTPEEWGFNVPAVPDWNVTPVNCDPRPVWDLDSDTFVTPPRCDKFLDLLARTQWSRFVTLGDEFRAQLLEAEALDGRLDHWQDLMAPLVAEDPTLDAAYVASEQASFRDILDDIIFDFDQYLERGLQEEQATPPIPDPELRPEPTAEELSALGYASGLDPARVNNFEFADGTPYMELPSAEVLSDEYSEVSMSWNEYSPIADSADARIDFVHHQSPGAYSEWVNLFLYAQDGTVDLTGYSQIEMTLRADKPRNVRVRIGGAASSDEFGGIWDEFGEYYSVDETPTAIVLSLRDLAYPDWAKEMWEPGQGWTTSDELARERILATFWGLIFVAGADVDEYGELLTYDDPGFLEVDNIYFR